MVHCGVRGVSRGFRGRILALQYFAMRINEGFNVNLSLLLITNSTQVGLLCINLRGASRIQDSVFTHSNYRMLERYMQGEVKCLEENWECGGSNVWVLFLKPAIKDACNISNLTVERTRISYGVNLRQTTVYLSSSAGLAVHIHPGLEDDIRITITKCYFMNNIGKKTAHLYLGIHSNCSILVKDSNFTYANRITEVDPMELVPMVHPDIGTLLFRVYWEYAIEVEVVLNDVCIAENVGGGLAVSFRLEFPQKNVQLRLKNVEVVHNFVVQDNIQVYGYFVRVEQHYMERSGLHTLLESVKISNNFILLQDENTWNQEQFGVTVALSICALSIMSTEVHFKQTEFCNNNIPAVYSCNSDLHFHGLNVFKNNTGRQCGGALVLKTVKCTYTNVLRSTF